MPNRPPEGPKHGLDALRARASVGFLAPVDLGDARARLDAALKGIESRAPRNHKRTRKEMRRFLGDKLPPWKRKASPWCRRAWRALGRRVPADTHARIEWEADLFALLWTAQCAYDTDQSGRAAVRAARKAASRWKLRRLAPRLRARERATPEAERPAFYAEHVLSYRVVGREDGPELAGWVTAGDVLLPRRGPLRRPFEDSAAELLMGYFADTLRLPERAAATLTVDLLRWMLGRRESEAALRRARQRHEPRKP
ncbi:MAG: hypothetical protein IT386_14800 [Deltaproteobacteria bacterium]|nr:hypothetical protein [Deltaproteobacteria bacterium]